MADETRKKREDQKPAERGLPIQTKQHILQAVNGIQYVSVQIVIHGGRGVEIERKESVRLDNEVFLPPRAAANAGPDHWRLGNSTMQG